MQVESITVREGTTARITMTLYSNDSAINLTGIHHIELHLRDSKNKVLRYSSSDDSPKVAIVTAASGIVGYDPASTDLIADRSPYNCYWWVFPTASTQYSCPEENEFQLIVRKEY